MNITINSEYEALLPKVSHAEFAQLKQSIRVNGLFLPLIVNAEGVLLDGHTRLRACQELDIEPRFETRAFSDSLSEKEFVVKANLERRHLNDFQRAELGKILLEIEREKTKQRQEAIEQVKQWLISDYRFTIQQDVRQDPTYQNIDIDFILKDLDGIFESPTLELKVRAKYYPDIAIETQSCVERQTQGYIYKSKATFLAYVYLENGKLNPHRFLFNLPELKKWFLFGFNRFKYRPILAPNPPENPVYHTEFYPVLISDIPKTVHVPICHMAANHGRRVDIFERV